APQDRELVVTPHELRHRAPQSQPPAFLPGKAIGPLRAPGLAVDRNELEPALQEGGRGRARHRLVRPDGLQELIEEGSLRALDVRVDVDPSHRAAEEPRTEREAELSPR